MNFMRRVYGIPQGSKGIAAGCRVPEFTASIAPGADLIFMKDYESSR